MDNKIKFANRRKELHEAVRPYCLNIIHSPELIDQLRKEIDNRQDRTELFEQFYLWAAVDE